MFRGKSIDRMAKYVIMVVWFFENVGMYWHSTVLRFKLWQSGDSAVSPYIRPAQTYLQKLMLMHWHKD